MANPLNFTFDNNTPFELDQRGVSEANGRSVGHPNLASANTKRPSAYRNEVSVSWVYINGIPVPVPHRYIGGFGDSNLKPVFKTIGGVSIFATETESDLKVAASAIDGEIPEDNLPPVYFDISEVGGLEGTGTQNDPYRLSASIISRLEALEGGGGGGNTTPVAPVPVADDTADTLSFTHALGTSELEVSIDNAAPVAYAGPYNIGDIALASGYYRARVKAATGRNASAYASSPAFTVAGGGGGGDAVILHSTTDMSAAYTNMNYTPNVVASPVNAEMTGDRAMENASANVYHYFEKSITIPNSGLLTLSFYLRLIGRTKFQLNVTDSSTGSISTIFKTTDGSADTFSIGGGWTNVNCRMISEVDNWWRVIISANKAADTITMSPTITIFENDADTTGLYTGDVTKGIEWANLMVEEGGEATTWGPVS